MTTGEISLVVLNPGKRTIMDGRRNAKLKSDTKGNRRRIHISIPIPIAIPTPISSQIRYHPDQGVLWIGMIRRSMNPLDTYWLSQ
jgi:hypothetical protein